jgi:acyl-CoA dehydrogenase
MFTEAIEAILRDRATPEVIRAIENGAAPSTVWDSLEEAGFLELLTPES